MALADDITAARKDGQSDDHILQAYKAFNPSLAGDIDKSIQDGQSSSHVLDALGAFDPTNVNNQPWYDRYGKALMSGVSDEASGIGNTLKQTVGPGVLSNVADTAAQATKPSDYQSASAAVANPNSSFGDRVSNVPRAVVESAPGIATDAAAGATGSTIGGFLGALGGPFAEFTVPGGAYLGGLAGIGLSQYLRTYGDKAKEAAVSRTGDPNATPNNDDQNRALLSVAANTGLSAIGIKGATGELATKAGDSIASNAIGNIAKAGAIDAGTGAAGTAIDQALLNRQDPTQDPTGLALAGVQGAATGAAMRAPGVIQDRNIGMKFSDVDPVMGQHIADTLYPKDLDYTNPKVAGSAVQNADQALQAETQTHLSTLAPQLKAMEQASGYTDDIRSDIAGTVRDLNNNQVVAPGRIQDLQDRVGSSSEGDRLVQALQMQNVHNQIKQVGNYDPSAGTFGQTGILGSDLGSMFLNPFNGLGKKLTSADALQTALSTVAGTHLPALGLGHLTDPSIGAGIFAGQMAVHSAAKAVDRLMGNSDPLGNFVNRFSSNDRPQQAGLQTGQPTPLTTSDKPSFRQTMQDTKDQMALEKSQAKAAAKEQADNNRTQKIADQTGQRVAELARRSIVVQKALEDRQNNQIANQTAREVAQAGKAQVRSDQAAQRAQDAQNNSIARETARQVGALAKGQINADRAKSRADEAKTNAIAADTARQAAALAKYQINSDRAAKRQESPVIPGMSKSDVADIRRQVGVFNHLDRLKAQAAKADKKSSVGAPKAANDSVAPKRTPQPGPPHEGVDAGMAHVTHLGHTVTFNTAGIRNVPAYKAGIMQRLEDRQTVIDNAKTIVPEEAHPVLDLIHHSLNAPTVETTHDAQGVVEDIANDYPKHTGEILDALNQPKLWATFKHPKAKSN